MSHYRGWACAWLVATTVCLIGQVQAEETLRIANWNVTNYSSGRTSAFQTAIYGAYSGRYMRPDILIGQEFLSSSAVTNFLNLLNTAPDSPGDWAAATFVNGPDSDSAFFYRTSKVTMATDLSANGVTTVSAGGYAPNHPRHLMRYDVVVAEGTPYETGLAIYSTHMKAGSDSDDQARRLEEAQELRANAEYVKLVRPDWYFLVGGDFNIQSSSQSAYQWMTQSQADNSGRFFDPINRPGNWNNSSSYRVIHTQDPVGAGGMDDRHDQILLSAGLIDGEGIDYVGHAAIAHSLSTWNDPNHSYTAWGNDGTSYNTTLRITGNQMVGSVIASALVTSAVDGGHLPVFLDIEIPDWCFMFDCDCDGDIDLQDFEEMEDCFSGVPGSPDFDDPTSPCLACFDADEDGDIDMADFAAFSLARN